MTPDLPRPAAVSLEWKDIVSCPRVHGRPILLFEPGFGIQVGQWDARKGAFISTERAFAIPFKLDRLRTADDLFEVVPIHATRWADVDLGDPAGDEAPRPAPLPPQVPRRPTLRLLKGGLEA